MGLLEKCISIGVAIGIINITLITTIFNTSFFNEVISWVILTISIGSGIIIALIVDDRAKQSHEEVRTSQEEITTLITKLNESDRRHNEILNLLEKNTQANEELAVNSIISTLEYIINMLQRLFKVIDENNVKSGDDKLVENLLGHLESPLNLIIQTQPNTRKRFECQSTKLTTSVQTLRKLVITSIVIKDDYSIKRTVKALSKNKEQLENIQKKINNHM